jgi:hypothetical protein
MRFEHLQRQHKKRLPEEAVSTFPEHSIHVHGGNPDGSDDVLKDIEVAVAEHDKLMHELGHHTLEHVE